MKNLLNKIVAPFIKAWDKFIDKLLESSAFQSLKQRFEELDPKKQTFLVGGSLVFVMVLIVGSISFGYYNLYSLKQTYSSNQEIISTLEQVSKDLQEMKQKMNRLAAGLGSKSPTQILTTMVPTSLISVNSVKVGSEIPSNSGSDQIKETVIDVTMTKVSIKQVVRYCNQIENSRKGLRVKQLIIETNNDPTGYMNATVKVASYTLEGRE